MLFQFYRGMIYVEQHALFSPCLWALSSSTPTIFYFRDTCVKLPLPPLPPFLPLSSFMTYTHTHSIYLHICEHLSIGPTWDMDSMQGRTCSFWDYPVSYFKWRFRIHSLSRFFPLPFKPDKIPLYICRIFAFCLSVDSRLGWFYSLAAADSDTVSMEAQGPPGWGTQFCGWSQEQGSWVLCLDPAVVSRETLIMTPEVPCGKHSLHCRYRGCKARRPAEGRVTSGH